MSSEFSLTSDVNRRPWLLRGALVGINALALTGVVATVFVGRPRFFGMAVIYAVTVLVLDLLVAIPQCSRRTEAGVHAGRIRAVVPVLQDRRTVVTVLLLAVLTLEVVGPGVLYFAVLTALFGLVGLRILPSEYGQGGWYFDLGIIIVAGALVLVSQALTVPYYARTFDTIYHTTLTRRIAAFGSLDPVLGTRYDDLALFHTQASVGVRATGMGPRLYAGAFVAALYALMAVPVFALIRNLFDSTRLALLGALLLVSNPAFIRWGTQVHAQSLNFAFLVTFLLLLSRWRSDYRITLLTVPVVVAMVMTHHLSTAMATVLVAIPLGLVLLGRRSFGAVVQYRGALVRYLLLVVAVPTYWYLTGIISGVRLWVSEVNPAASDGIPTRQFLIETFTDPVSLAGAAVPFIINNSYYAPLLAFGGFSVWYLLKRGVGNLSSPTLLAVGTFLIGIVLYVPNPLWAPLRGVFAFPRWAIMALPFLVLAPALGLWAFVSGRGRGVSSAVASGLLFALIFTSLGGGFSDPSLAGVAGDERGARKYISEEGLAASGFIAEHRGQRAGYGPSLFPRLLQCQEWTERGPDTPRGYDRMVVTDGTVDVRPGLTLMPEDAFRESNIKVAYRSPKTELYDAGTLVFTPVSDETVDWTPDRHSVVYTNGATTVAYAPGSERPAGKRCG